MLNSIEDSVIYAIYIYSNVIAPLLIILHILNPDYLILILCSFNLKPNISLSTPDKADKITTLIVVKRKGLALRPEILKGVSNSFNRSAANFKTLFETIKSSFFLGFFSIWNYK